MQWCDTASLKVINFLLANDLGKARILLLCLYRDIDLKEAPNPAVTRFIEESKRDVRFRFIHLSRLSNEQVTELIEKVFSLNRDVAGNGFNKLIYSKTSGNPLFIGEILKSLLEKQIIFRDGKAEWSFPRIADGFLLPETIRNVIEQRLQLLDVSTLEILRIASVIGEQFSIEVLRKVTSPLPIGDVLVQSSLERLRKSGLLSDREYSPGIPGYMFSDESVRSVLYDQVSLEHRRGYHLMVAQSLEQQLAGQAENLRNEHASDLAHHYLFGGNPAKAQVYLIKAAERAAELYAHSEAYAYYRTSLELIENTEKDQLEQNVVLRAQLSERMGDESQFLPEYGVLECWKKAAALYERCGKGLRAANVLLKLGMTYHLAMYELEESDRAFEKAIELARDDPRTPSADLANLILYSCLVNVWRRERQKVKEKFALAARLAKESGTDDLLAMASSSVFAENLVGEIEETLETCNRGLKIALEHNLTLEACYCYFQRAVAHNYTYGPSRKSLELFLEGLNFTATRGHFMMNLFHKVELVHGIYLPLGDWAKAREMAEESLKSVREFPPNSLFSLIARSATGHVLLHMGDLEKAEGFLEHVIRATKGYGVAQLDIPLYIALARLNIEKGNFHEAEKRLEEGYRFSKQRGLTVVNGIPHVQLLSLIIEFSLLKVSGDEERNPDYLQNLESTLEELSETAKVINQEWPRAYLFRAKGLIAGRRRQIEKAVFLFQSEH